jgi:hypothetical protein
MAALKNKTEAACRMDLGMTSVTSTCTLAVSNLEVSVSCNNETFTVEEKHAGHGTSSHFHLKCLPMLYMLHHYYQNRTPGRISTAQICAVLQIS